MRRREFIRLFGAAAAACPVVALAQGEQMRRVGVLLPLPESDPEQMSRIAALRQELERLGWSDGRNVRIDARYAAGGASEFAALAKQLVAMRPDVIFVQSTAFVAAVQRETRTLPIVFVNVSDPVGAGFVESLARPGGNLTGFMLFEGSVAAKWLAMLKEVSPGLKRAALLIDPRTSPYDYFLRPAEAAAASLGVEMMASRVGTRAEIEQAFDTVMRGRHGGILIAAGSTMLSNRDLIIELAARHRVPVVYPERVYAIDGGLMSYGIADLNEPFRQAASYVDRILRGEKPAELPVQAPTKYSTVVNLKTAKALGITVPPTLMVAADEVIE